MGRGFGRGAGAYRLHCWQNRWRRPATSTTGALECVWHTLCLRQYCAASFRSALHRSAWHLGPPPPPAAAPLLAGTGDGEELETPPTAASLGGFWSSSSPCGGSAPSAEPEPELDPSPAAAAAASAAMDAAAELEVPLRSMAAPSGDEPIEESRRGGGAVREPRLLACLALMSGGR